MATNAWNCWVFAVFARYFHIKSHLLIYTISNNLMGNCLFLIFQSKRCKFFFCGNMFCQLMQKSRLTGKFFCCNNFINCDSIYFLECWYMFGKPKHIILMTGNFYFKCYMAPFFNSQFKFWTVTYQESLWLDHFLFVLWQHAKSKPFIKILKTKTFILNWFIKMK